MKRYHEAAGLSGLMAGIAAKLTGQSRVMHMQPQGVSHSVELRVPSTDLDTYAQVFLADEYRFYVDRPPATIVDAGANVGLASVYFAHKYPEAKIYAIEPERANFAMLQRNVAPYPNVTTINAAMWGQDKEITLVDSGLGSSGFITQETGATDEQLGTGMHQIVGMTVPSLMAEYDLDHIDVFKIDIEGAERELFEGTPAWLDKVDALIVELHERLKTGCNRNFYNATNGFDREWSRGENVYLARERGCNMRPTR